MYRFKRLIKLCFSLALTGMASRTLKAKYEAEDDARLEEVTLRV